MASVHCSARIFNCHLSTVGICAPERCPLPRPYTCLYKPSDLKPDILADPTVPGRGQKKKSKTFVIESRKRSEEPCLGCLAEQQGGLESQGYDKGHL